MALVDFDSYQEKRLSSLRTQLGQQQDDMISKVNLLWKTVSKKLDDTTLCNTAGGLTTQMNFTSTNYHTKEELQSKGIKSPLKLLTLKLEPRRKRSNPKKNCNFVGRVKGLKVFVWNVSYECDFMVLEDTTSVIDHYLGSVVFRKPFMEATRLVYDKDEGTVMFERDKEKIIFKMPYKIDMFKHIDFTDRGTNSIPHFIIERDDDNCKKIHYSKSLDLGPEYKYDKSVCREIRSLMAAKAKRKNKGEVMKFLIKNEKEIFTDAGDDVKIYPDGVASPAM
ncbi:hypothetical protein Tco_1576255 [Tanacetum coccineum]